MAKMGNGYGSEYHLLRFLGRHRAYFNQQVCAAVETTEVEWLDHQFDSGAPTKDHEWKSLDFIGADSAVVKEWQKWWPIGRGIHNWDAVGRIKAGDNWEWVLVEAKANLEEIRSSCGAVQGKDQIRKALDEVKVALGAAPDRNWLTGYYQFCNRVAALHFLNGHAQSAHLLFIYFVGDRISGRTCPKTDTGWEKA